MGLSRAFGLSLALGVAVCVADLFVPRGVAVGILYPLLILVGLRAPDRREALLLAAAFGVLVVVGGWLSPPGESDWMFLTNRVLSLVLIVASGATVALYVEAQAERDRSRLSERAVLDTAEAVVIGLDLDGRVTLLNRAGQELLGLSEQEVLGAPWLETFVPEQERHAVGQILERLEAGRLELAATHENRVRRSDGDLRLVAWRNSLLQDASGRVTGVLGTGQDVTDLRAAEAALGESRRALMDLKYALDASSIVAITDARGRITYANDTFCAISRYRREEIIGQDHRILNSGHHPKAFFADLWGTIQAGRVWKGEIRNRAKDGTIYWVDTTIVPFLDEAGLPYQYLAIRSDITERKAAEQRLVEQGSLVRLGQMAAVVAHEVRNPIAGISGALQIVGGRMPPEAPERAILQEITARLAALDSTVSDLLLFARPKLPERVPVPLSDLIGQVAEMLARDPQTRGVSVVGPGGDLRLHVDPDQVRPLFHNLLLNAAQAMRGQGVVRVSVRPAGEACEVLVADEGPGIEPQVRSRLFEPFFTTKPRGTGLGLAIARRVVELHGGSIQVDCPPEGGTIVRVVLPVAREVRA